MTSRSTCPNLPFCLSVTVLMVLGLRRLWLADRATALPFLAVVVLFPFPYYLSHSSMDYRQPIETIVVLLVARALIREPLGESIMDTAFKHQRRAGVGDCPSPL